MSPQKHAAQIANAKLSHGAVTEKGRHRSSANSTRHGLASRKLRIIPPEDRDEFNELCSEMLPALAPEGPIENHLADLIVFDEWRRIRIRGLENEIFAMGFTKAKDEFFAGAELWLSHSKELATLTLYEQRITRVLIQNKAEFEGRQCTRKAHGADLLVCALPTTQSQQPEAPAASGADLPVCGTPVPHPGALPPTQTQQPVLTSAESKPETSAPAESSSDAVTAPETIGGFVRSSAAASPVPAAQLPNSTAELPESTPAPIPIPQGALRNAA